MGENTKLYELHEGIAKLINDANLPSMAVYFVIKDIMHDVEKCAFASLDVEKMRGEQVNE